MSDSCELTEGLGRHSGVHGNFGDRHMMYDCAIASTHLHGNDPLVFGERHFDKLRNIGDFTGGWQMKFRQRDDNVGGKSLRVQPAFRKSRRWRQISIVSFGSTGI